MRSPRRQGEGPETETAVSPSAVRGQFHVPAIEKARQPAVGSAQIENENAGIVLEGLNQQEIERKALARSGGSQHEGVPDVAGKKIVVIGRLPLRLEDRERRLSQMAACRGAPRRPEDRSHAGRRASRHEHGADLPGPGLRGQPREERRELPVAFSDHLRVMAGEDAPDVAVQLFALRERSMNPNRERDIAIGHPLGFQFHQRIAQPVRFRGRRRVLHRNRGPFGFLHVSAHRVAL